MACLQLEQRCIHKGAPPALGKHKLRCLEADVKSEQNSLHLQMLYVHLGFLEAPLSPRGSKVQTQAVPTEPAISNLLPCGLQSVSGSPSEN